jgi:hypothetical protein
MGPKVVQKHWKFVAGWPEKGPRDSSPGRRLTWVPKGETLIQYSWDRHDRLSVISAITLSPVRQQLGLPPS